MILHTEVYSIGRLVKPHGIQGEIGFAFTSDVFDRTQSPYWVLEMDGILVPFFIESVRFKSSETALVKFEGFNSDTKVRELSGKEVYYPAKYAAKEAQSEDDWAFYLGFSVFDENEGYLGEVTEIDDSTLNVLFKLCKDDREILMPVAEEFFKEVDVENREMHVSLPEGLIDL